MPFRKAAQGREAAMPPGGSGGTMGAAAGGCPIVARSLGRFRAFWRAARL